MYARDTLVLLRHFLESGLSKTAIANQLSISRRLVYHLIATGQLDRDLGEDAVPRTRGDRRRRGIILVLGLAMTAIAMLLAAPV